MKHLAAFGPIVYLLFAIAPGTVAQYENRDWIELSPAGESFHVSMPNQARAENEKLGSVSGKRYTTSIGIASYAVWSLTDANHSANADTDEYLDASAELVWEGLLKPAREKLDDKEQRLARMIYVRDLSSEGLPGREYTVTIGDVTGTTEFFVAREHLYVLSAMGKPGADWPSERFFSSFRSGSPSPAIEQPKTSAINGAGAGNRAATPEATDYNRIFTSREVTQKVRVLEKREPSYTESARKFAVQGTVVLRCVFSKNGEVTNLHVVRKLPHGLTQNAINAARRITFTPAVLDGHPVSMWMELQYNFNLY